MQRDILKNQYSDQNKKIIMDVQPSDDLVSQVHSIISQLFETVQIKTQAKSNSGSKGIQFSCLVQQKDKEEEEENLYEDLDNMLLDQKIPSLVGQMLPDFLSYLQAKLDKTAQEINQCFSTKSDQPFNTPDDSPRNSKKKDKRVNAVSQHQQMKHVLFENDDKHLELKLKKDKTPNSKRAVSP